MNFERNTGKKIQDAFVKFDQDNPQVYIIFSGYVFRAIQANKKRISSKLIINQIRWQLFMETTDSVEVILHGQGKHFKINDAYSSRYARKFIAENPGAEAYFELRELRS